MNSPSASPATFSSTPVPETLYYSEKDKRGMTFSSIMLDYPDISLHIKHVLFSAVHALKEVAFGIGREDTRVLCYGDSTFNFINGVDRYHTQLDALITSKLKSRVVSFHKNWFDSRVLGHIARLLPPAADKLVIIPVNLKFLSDFEYYCPMGSFPILDIALGHMDKTLSLGEALERTFVENLKSTYDERIEAYMNRMIDGVSLGDPVAVRDVEQEMKSSHEYRMVVRYCHDTGRLEAKLDHFLAAIASLRTKGYTPLCYVTPLPVIQMQRMVPGHYPTAVRNIALVRKKLEEVCRVEDYSHLLLEEETYDTATHLTVAGADKLAGALARAVNQCFSLERYIHPDALYRVDTSQILRCAVGEGRFIHGFSAANDRKEGDFGDGAPDTEACGDQKYPM